MFNEVLVAESHLAVFAPANLPYSYGLCNRIDISYFDLEYPANIESLNENIKNLDLHQL